jgi:peptide/nickel transport system permease protein
MNKLLYLVKRLLLGVPVMLFGLTMVFLIVYVFSPINPALQVLGRDATQADVRQLEIAMNIRYPNGRPVPLWDKYWQFLTDMLTFDLGQSWVVQRPRPVEGLIMDRLPATIWLGFWSVVIALLLGIPIGFYAGLRNNTWSDYTASAGGIVWRAMPNFWLAVMIAGLMSGAGALAFYRDWITPTQVVGTPESVTNLFDVASPFAGVPVLGMVGIPIPNVFEMGVAFKWILPAALVLGSSSMGNEVRIGRTAVVESLNAKYIETAKAKGVPPRKIISKHVGRNALLPLLPVIMGEFYVLIGGSVIVEQVFAIQGLGNLFFRAAVGSDLPVVMSIAYLFIIIQILFNITQDLLYTYIDPRIDLGDQDR